MAQIHINRILFATDFLESSRLALDYAVALANHFQATIEMLHVLELSVAAAEAETLGQKQSHMRHMAVERINSLAEGVRRLGITVEVRIEDGIPANVILAATKSDHIDLLVLGIHGVHRGIDHLLIGSNTERILLAATCPTLTVGAHVLSGVDIHLHFDEIIYFSDFTPEAAAAAAYAVFFSKEFHAPIEVCQLSPRASESGERVQQKLVDEYCNSMKRALDGEDSEWCKPAFHLERGMETDQMIERAQNQHAGLIILGVRTASQLARHLHTSFAYRLLAGATCPVLSISRAGAETDEGKV
ncbi:MAG: universal stress protein [Acidobacteriaceae bacterium]